MERTDTNRPRAWPKKLGNLEKNSLRVVIVQFWRCKSSRISKREKSKEAARKRSLKLLLHTFLLEEKYAPLAQLVEQLTLNQWVHGSSPWWCTRKEACEVSDGLTGVTFKEHKPKVLLLWPVGQAAKTAASHAANGSSILPRVTKITVDKTWGMC